MMLIMIIYYFLCIILRQTGCLRTFAAGLSALVPFRGNAIKPQDSMKKPAKCHKGVGRA